MTYQFISKLVELYNNRVDWVDLVTKAAGDAPKFRDCSIELAKLDEELIELENQCTIVDIRKQYSYLQGILKKELDILKKFIELKRVKLSNLENFLTPLPKTTNYFNQIIGFIFGRTKGESKLRIIRAIEQKDFDLALFLNRRKQLLSDEERAVIKKLIEFIRANDIASSKGFLKSQECARVFSQKEIEFLNKVAGITVPILILIPIPTNSTGENNLKEPIDKIEVVSSYYQTERTLKEYGTYSLPIGIGGNNQIKLADSKIYCDDFAGLFQVCITFAEDKGRFSILVPYESTIAKINNSIVRQGVWSNLNNGDNLKINEYEFDVSITSKPLPDEKKYKEQFPIVLRLKEITPPSKLTLDIIKPAPREAPDPRPLLYIGEYVDELEAKAIGRRSELINSERLENVLFQWFVEGTFKSGSIYKQCIHQGRSGPHRANYSTRIDPDVAPAPGKLIVSLTLFSKQVGGKQRTLASKEIDVLLVERGAREEELQPEIQIIIDSPPKEPKPILYIGESVHNLEAHAEGTHKGIKDINEEKGYKFAWWIQQGNMHGFLSIGRRVETSHWPISQSFKEGGAELVVTISIGLTPRFDEKEFIAKSKPLPVTLKKRGEGEEPTKPPETPPPPPAIQIIIDSPQPNSELYIGEEVHNLEAHAEGTHKDIKAINEGKGHNFGWWIQQGRGYDYLDSGTRIVDTSFYSIPSYFKEGGAELVVTISIGQISGFNDEDIIAKSKPLPVILKKRGEEAPPPEPSTPPDERLSWENVDKYSEPQRAGQPPSPAEEIAKEGKAAQEELERRKREGRYSIE